MMEAEDEVTTTNVALLLQEDPGLAGILITLTDYPSKGFGPTI